MFIDFKSSPKFIGRSSTVYSYLEDIRKYPVLSIEEEYEIFKKIKNGETNLRNKIIESNQRFVFAIAKRYATTETNLLDIINEGNIGLIKAIDTFDENLGYKFTTYAIWYITREINYFLNNNESIIQKSNNVKTNKKVEKIKNKFLALNGYYPSNDEIIKELKDKYNCNIVDKRDLFDLTIDSIDSSLSDDDDSFTINDSITFNNKSSVYNLYLKEENNDYIKLLINNLLPSLTEREETIIKLLFGIDYDRAYEINEVAYILDMSSERIRQIKMEALSKLKNELLTKKIAI